MQSFARSECPEVLVSDFAEREASFSRALRLILRGSGILATQEINSLRKPVYLRSHFVPSSCKKKGGGRLRVRNNVRPLVTKYWVEETGMQVVFGKLPR